MIEIINSILTVILTAVMGYVVWLLKQHVENKSLFRDALKVVLRELIELKYDMFLDREDLTKEEFGDFENLCNVYFKLHGNGSGQRMYEEIKKKTIRG